MFTAALVTKLAVDEGQLEVRLPSLVHGVLTPADVAQVKSRFDDAKKGEKHPDAIDVKEFTKVIKKLMKDVKEKPPSDSDLKAAFKEADTDGGGTVDLDEFTVLFARVKKGEVKGLGGGGGKLFSMGLRTAKKDESKPEEINPDETEPEGEKPVRPSREEVIPDLVGERLLAIAKAIQSSGGLTTQFIYRAESMSLSRIESVAEDCKGVDRVFGIFKGAKLGSKLFGDRCFIVISRCIQISTQSIMHSRTH